MRGIRRCNDKIKYKTRSVAIVSASSILRQNRQDTSCLRAYQCQYCNGWHLTKSNDEEVMR